MKKIRYDIISPDGFAIQIGDGYPTKEKAEIAFSKWVERFKAQGYYSSSYGRINLNELRENCEMVEC